ncbi:MAG: EFR1 family ferrodoxin [Candidatus Helarchaeota archaeon]|nr:EFR1 family ferrodoxin [Candidatus Helarchaeota archaeon]
MLIIYFSQTGGTEKIAKAIQQGVLESGNSCDLVKIKAAASKNLKNYDLIGFGCPTFYYREPINVRTFIRQLREEQNKHCFIFCAHGSSKGNTFYYLKEELNKKGLVVIGAFDSYSESSLQFYPKPMHTDKHPDSIEIEGAQKFGSEICELSLRINRGELNLVPAIELVENTWWARDSKLMTLEVLRKTTPELKINWEKCINCLVCQENCPVDAIDIANKQIQKEGCIFCWFCEKSCPEAAIEADWSLMNKWARTNLKKYVKILEAEEAEGKFRPYVDYRKII